jgi:hypothetical protein
MSQMNIEITQAHNIVQEAGVSHEQHKWIVVVPGGKPIGRRKEDRPRDPTSEL